MNFIIRDKSYQDTESSPSGSTIKHIDIRTIAMKGEVIMSIHCPDMLLAQIQDELTKANLAFKVEANKLIKIADDEGLDCPNNISCALKVLRDASLISDSFAREICRNFPEGLGGTWSFSVGDTFQPAEIPEMMRRYSPTSYLPIEDAPSPLLDCVPRAPWGSRLFGAYLERVMDPEMPQQYNKRS